MQAYDPDCLPYRLAAWQLVRFCTVSTLAQALVTPRSSTSTVRVRIGNKAVPPR